MSRNLSLRFLAPRLQDCAAEKRFAETPLGIFLRLEIRFIYLQIITAYYNLSFFLKTPGWVNEHTNDVGTDATSTFPVHGFSLHDELALFVQAGLAPMEALQTATLNPAKFLGLTELLGTVERGKLADLVLLDANPLGDISNTKKIAAVIINGRYMRRETLDKMLADVEAAANRK